MSDDIKLETIKLTQATLGKYLKKPTLTDRLLKKPPFRFLHDVTTSVIRETGFMAGLFTDFEMISDNMKDRDAKIIFLQKLIDCVQMVTGKKLSVRPNKIVAGLEPTNTNELLQAIGYALSKKLDSSEAVAEIMNDNNLPSSLSNSKSKSKEERKTSIKADKTRTSAVTNNKIKKSSESKVSNKTTTADIDNKKLIKGSSKIIKNSPKDKIKVQDSPRVANDKHKLIKESHILVKDKQTEKLDKKRTKQVKVKPEKQESKQETLGFYPAETLLDTPKIIEDISEIIEQPTQIIKESLQINKDALKADKVEATKIVNESSEIKVSQRMQENVNSLKISEQEQIEELSPKIIKASPKAFEPIDLITKSQSRPKTATLRPPSARPSSARPGAPRLKDRAEPPLPFDEIISMGKVQVIIENYASNDTQLIEEDNEETVVVIAQEETIFKPELEPEIPTEKGHLVAQILEKIEEGSAQRKVEIEWQTTADKREREAANREMKKLRDSIQIITRAANPLGKLISFLQEDVDSMRSELVFWLDINQKLTDEIQTLKKNNNESIEPLKRQLNHLNDEIAKQYELIAVSQANILRNEQKIKMLLNRN